MIARTAWALTVLAAAMTTALPAGLAQDSATTATATAPASAQAEADAEAGAVEIPREITEAATVEAALAYSPAERNILSAVRDTGEWNTTAFYVLLRRSAMLPTGPKTIDEAEQPNARDFWKEPQRYRGRLVRFEGKIPRPITEWTGRLTGTPWWGGRPVYMVDVIEESTGQPMLVAMISEPHGNIFLKQKLRFAGVFYKLVSLPENPETGDPNKAHEYPVIVAKQFYSAPVDRGGDVPWHVAVIVVALAALAAAFVALRQRNRRLLRRDALGQERRRREAPEEYEDAPVDEELRRQVESYQADRGKDSGEGDGGR